MIKKVCKKEITILFVLYLIVLKYLIKNRESAFTFYLYWLIISFSTQNEIKSQVRSKKTPDKVKKDFDVCGKVLINKSKIANLPSGNKYYNARWYDPNLGRFITEDPARDGNNWFVYVNNNPLKFVDPTGLREVIADDMHGNPMFTEKDYMRNIEAQVDSYDDKLTTAGSIDEAASYTDEQERLKEEYNRAVAAGVDTGFNPNLKITDGFDTDQGLKGNYQTTKHTGIDVIPTDPSNPSGLKTPYYTQVERSEKGGSNQIVVSVPGTTIRGRIKHTDVEDLPSSGSTYKPGQTVVPFPERNNSNFPSSSTGPHFHVEATMIIDGRRQLVNPTTLVPAKGPIFWTSDNWTTRSKANTRW